MAETTTQDVIETERAGLAKYTEDKNNEILGLNNELARLQTKLDEVKASAMKWYDFSYIENCHSMYTVLSTGTVNGTESRPQLPGRPYCWARSRWLLTTCILSCTNIYKEKLLSLRQKILAYNWTG